MSKPANFAAPEDVEQAFYEAVQRGDADLLIQLWADDEETLCVHPTGVRLLGILPIRESWRGIFAGNPRFTVRVAHSVRWSGMLLAVHSVVETLYAGDATTPQGSLLATNVLQRGASGWRLLAHHASAAGEDGHDEAGDGAPRTLH